MQCVRGRNPKVRPVRSYMFSFPLTIRLLLKGMHCAKNSSGVAGAILVRLLPYSVFKKGNVALAC